MTSDKDQPLSLAGRRRRQEILAIASDAARSRARRQKATRSIGVIAVAGAIAAVVWPLAAPRSPISPPTAVTPPVSQPSTAVAPVLADALPTIHIVRQSRPNIVVQTIATDTTLVDRFAVRPSAGGWEAIGTDELLQQLSANGLAGGVVVRDGKPTIWFSAAADGH